MPFFIYNLTSHFWILLCQKKSFHSLYLICPWKQQARKKKKIKKRGNKETTIKQIGCGWGWWRKRKRKGRFGTREEKNTIGGKTTIPAPPYFVCLGGRRVGPGGLTLLLFGPKCITEKIKKEKIMLRTKILKTILCSLMRSVDCSVAKSAMD